MQLLSEAFTRLVYKEFFTEKGVDLYATEFSILSQLKTAVQARNIADSQMYLAEFMEATGQ